MGCTSSLKEPYMIPDPYAKEVEGETVVHINNTYRKTKEYIDDIEKTTAFSFFEKSFKAYSEHPCLGYRKPLTDSEYSKEYTYLTYKEVRSLSENFIQNAKKHDLIDSKTFDDQPGSWKIFGLFARNCVEWVVTDIALQMDDTTCVTFYSTLGAESFDHIFNQTQAKTVAVSPESIKKLAEYHKKFNFSSLKNVVIFDYTLTFKNQDADSLRELGINIFLFSELIKKPTEIATLTPPTPNSIITLCYTSGTTSLPKGAMLTQKGIATQFYLLKDTGFEMTTSDTFISYLPLAHVMERVSISVALFFGAKIGFISGLDVKKYLMEDLPIMKPTILVAVPRILINFHQKVLETFSKLKGCSKSMANKALRTKRENYDSDQDIYHSLYDRLVFKKVREKFGGQLRVVICGSAPLPRDISKDIKLMLSCPLIEGYGMTELCGGSNGTSINDFSNTNVGSVLRTLYLKLVDRNELNYNSKTLLDNKSAPTGEICYKGPSVFQGYFRDEKNTKDTIDNEGWMHTGDVGMIDPLNKGLKIIDRVKEIFKLSQGEYIAPAKLEGAYNKSPYVGQICIYGNSEKSNIIAIIVVNKQKCAEVLLQEGKLKQGEELLEEHLKEPKLIEAIKLNFDEIAKFNKFNTLEKPPKFILTLKEFTIQNDLLTPTMKLVRKKIQNFFQKEIDEAYN